MPVFPVAPGHPDYSSTGTNKFIPQIWSSRMILNFYTATVFGEIANTDYEGEIRDMGDTVVIRTIPAIIIDDYYKGMGLTYRHYESQSVDLQINKGKWFGFPVNDVDKKQADIPFVDKWSSDAGMRMKITIDAQILGTVYADVHASNKGTTAGVKSSSYNMGTTGSPIAVSKVNVVDMIVDCSAVLTEQDVPEEEDRWIVIPVWMANLLKKSDLKDASMTGDTISPLRNGRLGKIDNFTIYVSNNYTAVTDGAYSCYHVLFGHKSGITFASQMTKMETLKNPNDFGDLVRGLNVYGFEVIKSLSIGDFYCRKST